VSFKPWDILKAIWPIEDRPEQFQNEDFINSMSLENNLALKKCWEEQQKKENRGEETFRQDTALPTRHFPAGPDNCADLLHPVRYSNLEPVRFKLNFRD